MFSETGFPIVITVVVITLTSSFLLITKDWRYCIAALALQYIGVFVLVNTYWPIEMAVAKMVAGWMAGAILGIAMTSIPDTFREVEHHVVLGPAFRIIAAIIIGLTVTSLVFHSSTWFSMMNSTILWGSFILIGFGLLQVSFTSHPFRVVIGLLTSLSGFEIIYAGIESSTLVTGLLAGINLGLALVGAYMIIAPSMESNP